MIDKMSSPFPKSHFSSELIRGKRLLLTSQKFAGDAFIDHLGEQSGAEMIPSALNVSCELKSIPINVCRA